jgi:hypothetical protein
VAEIFEGMNNRVRMILNMSPEQLPNEKIESFDFGGIAKITIDNIVDKPTLTQEEQELINSCYVYQTCLNILPTLTYNSIKVQQTTHAKIEYKDVPINEMTETIKDRLNQCLIMLECNVGYSSTIFTISNPESRYEGEIYHI